MTHCRAYFIAGTDTEVGKTFATAALIHAARSQGLRALGMKPVAAGAEVVEGIRINEDAAILLRAGSFDPGLELINPYCLLTPVAPHIAASEEGVCIDPGRIVDRFEQLARSADCVFVEGVGGFRVPLGPDYDSADLACKLALPVILVVGMRLGCINHALLTADAIRHRGLAFAGWIANCIDPAMLRLQQNLDALSSRLGPPLAVLPHVEHADASAVAHLVNLPR